MTNEEAVRILRNPEEIFYSGDQLIQTEDAIEIAKIIEKQEKKIYKLFKHNQELINKSFDHDLRDANIKLVEKIQMLERIQKVKE